MFVTANQLYVFIACVAFGAVGGVLFSAAAAVKLALKGSPVLRVIPDVAAFVVLTVCYVVFSFRTGFPDFRIYMTAGVFTGIFAYMKTFHRTLAKFGKKAYNLLCKVLKILSKKLNQNTKGNKNDGIESKKTDSVDNGGGGVASRNTAVRSRLSARVHQKRARQL